MPGKKAKLETKGKSEEEISRGKIVRIFLQGYGSNANEEGKKEFNSIFSNYLAQEVSKHSCAANYNIAFLYDNTTLMKVDSDQIYNAVSSFGNDKPLLLFLLSGGGEPGAAYLIGKLCQEFSNGKLVVVIPRYAKSAATLLSCAANEIHMGSLSELGPIDPQINQMPTLGLKNSVEHIAELVSKNPGSSSMFAKYLKMSVEPIQIGYYERVAESAAQYAERLMENHQADLKSPASEIATRLVYGYKDHGFVIDRAEAESIFGEKIIKSNSPEYQLGNSIYEILSSIEQLAIAFDYKFYFIGSVSSKPNFFKKNPQ